MNDLLIPTVPDENKGREFASRQVIFFASVLTTGAGVGALAARDRLKGALLGAACSLPAFFAGGWIGDILGLPRVLDSEWSQIAGAGVLGAALEGGLIRLFGI